MMTWLDTLLTPKVDGWQVMHRCGGILRAISPDYHGWARTLTCSWCRASIEIHVTATGHQPRHVLVDAEVLP